MRRRSSSSNSSVEAREGASGWGRGVQRGGGGAAQFDHGFVGFPARKNGVDAAGCPGQLVLQHGVGAGAGLTHAVLDVGQGAHGELQAGGQVGAVAEAQCDAPNHDVVAEPFQGVSVHGSIMTHEGGKVEPPCPFLSVHSTKQRRSFPVYSGQVGPDLGDCVPEQFLNFLFRQPDHLHPWVPRPIRCGPPWHPAGSRRSTILS